MSIPNYYYYGLVRFDVMYTGFVYGHFDNFRSASQIIARDDCMAETSKSMNLSTTVIRNACAIHALFSVD